MDYRFLFCALAVLVTSGCMSAQTDVHISEDAEIEKLESEFTFELDRDSSEMEADTFSNNITGENLADQMNATENVNFNFSESNVTVINNENRTGVEMTYYDVELPENTNTTVYKEDGEVVFEDPNYALFETSDSTSGDILETGSSEETSQESGYTPYCLGGNGFIGENADISNYSVSDQGLELGLRSTTTDEINIKSFEIGGEEKQVDEQLGFYDTTSVVLENKDITESGDCKTYNASITYTRNGEEETASGELEIEYDVGGLNELKQNDGMGLDQEDSLGTDGLGMSSGFGETPQNLSELGTYGETMLSMMNESMDIKYRVHMPGEVVDTNGRKIDENVVEYGFDKVVKEEEGPYVRSKSGGGIINKVSSWITQIF